ncbi:ThiF family adenylyltransferase [Sphingomonas sp. Leaf198]|uniref:ThiF family adenylyltransferase n=1 Tax=Sphingomonas sp. Leaf198 TaxID=1736299 RepID=UPI0006FE3BA1|nr:ThiF family adenylyltransferase [Sphingomonas sp. Leaf198]KQS49510.1 hypothetical protein ASG20_10970 [Sphingomonas sp. Leaf198]
MAIPHDLAAAIESLPEDPRFEILDGWVDRGKGVWSFRFRAELSVTATVHMPEWTGWHVIATGAASDREFDIYPDADAGIVATFPHQNFNGEPPEGRPWRTGKPCLERPAAVFRREGWAGEPNEAGERLIWRIGRLFAWIDAAAQDRLLTDGDPLELPMYPTLDTSSVLGFRETAADIDWWVTPDQHWGFATIAEIPGARATAVIADFMDPHRRSIRRVPWSGAIPFVEKAVDAVWLTLPGLVVFAPWRTAATWRELSELCDGVSIDLASILADAGARLRRTQRRKHATPVLLLIGFPLEAEIGGPTERFHWIAVKNLRLCTRDDVRMGFSGSPEARRAWDRELATSNRRLEWQRTANWAPDQLRKRGEAEDGVRAKSVLVIGCGTLGAAVAENLLRMGVTRMGLLDHDTIHVGNLSRHLLTMSDAGRGKAERMAVRLNLAAPDANVVAMPFSFPPAKAADADRLKEWDVIVDCTASDAVLHDMASFPWGTERIFVSLAMTWQAEGLFAYTASETGFPAIDAMERYAAVSPTPEIERVGEMEGIGCWHPVFPATADDVSLWGAIGSKFVRRAILSPGEAASLYRQMDDGSVVRSYA